MFVVAAFSIALFLILSRSVIPPGYSSLRCPNSRHRFVNWKVRGIYLTLIGRGFPAELQLFNFETDISSVDYWDPCSADF